MACGVADRVGLSLDNASADRALGGLAHQYLADQLAGEQDRVER